MHTLASWKPMHLDHHVDSDCEGDAKEWFVVASQNRDSEPLERSNYRSLIRIAKEEGIEFHDERRGHWACGWVEVLAVRDEAWARKWLEALSDYPIVCDEDFSELEEEEEEADWDSWGRSTVVRETRRMVESVVGDLDDWAEAVGFDVDAEADRVRMEVMQNSSEDAKNTGIVSALLLWLLWLSDRPADPRAAVRHARVFWVAHGWRSHSRLHAVAGQTPQHRRK